MSTPWGRSGQGARLVEDWRLGGIEKVPAIPKDALGKGDQDGLRCTDGA